MELSLLFYRLMAPPCVLPLLLIVLAPLVLPIDGRSAVKKRSVMGAGATWPDEVYTTWMAAYKVCQRMRGWGLGVVSARERKIRLGSIKKKKMKSRRLTVACWHVNYVSNKEIK